MAIRGLFVACVSLRLLLGLLRWGFVQDQPVESELSDGFDELVEIDGFANVAVYAEVVAFGEIAVLLGAGEDDDGKAAGALVGANSAQDLEAIDFGKLQVEQHQCGRDRKSVV